MSGAKAPAVQVLELPRCLDKIKIKIMQKTMRNRGTSGEELLYMMDVRVRLMDNIKKIREMLARAENLNGWPLPTNGFTFRHQPLTANDAENDGVELMEGGGKTFKKLGIKDGDTIVVVPSASFNVSITGVGLNAISVDIRPSDKVATLREVLQQHQIENLPTHFKFSIGEVFMEDDMPFYSYRLCKDDRIRVTPQPAPQTSDLDQPENTEEQEAQDRYQP